MQRHTPILGILAMITLLLWGCSSILNISDTKPDPDSPSVQLLSMIEQTNDNPESQVVIVEQLIQNLRKTQRQDEIIPLLSGITARNPDNPYNAYYLTLIGEHLRTNGQPKAAYLYYYRAVYRYPDVEVSGSSVHYRALNQLLNTAQGAEKKMQHYHTLQSRFAGKIDPGLHHYYMAQNYEAIGDYDSAFDEYRRFTSYPDTRIPGRPNAYQTVTQLLDFKDSSRNWTYENLDDLVSEIQAAIATRNPARLTRNQAKTNFFAMSWKQDSNDANTQSNFDIGPFLLRNSIRYRAELEPRSNS
ncbi:MAG: hypothetical protein ACOCVC_04610, partial [Spirochaeta sp.]